MKWWYGGLAVLMLGLPACKSKKSPDQRQFGSLTVQKGENPDVTGGAKNPPPAEGPKLPPPAIPPVGVPSLPPANPPKEAPKPTVPTPTPPTPPKPTIVPDELKPRLARCFPQWESMLAGSSFEVRRTALDVNKLRRSNFQLTGDKAEIVFVDVSARDEIEKVFFSFENPKALYCLNITAQDEIEYLDIAYVCGARIGEVGLESRRIKQVNLHEYCGARP